MTQLDLFKHFFNQKTVLVTGHTGFKGSWLSIWLNELGAKVIGFSLDPKTQRDNFVLSNLSQKIIDIRGDIRKKEELEKVFTQYKPEIVFHLAAQAIVRKSYTEPIETYQTNVMGTINVLECLRKSLATKVGVFITTDKCYENKEQIWGYREKDPMGGFDPYSSSKGCAELAISSWRNSFMNLNQIETHGKAIASARAGNVIGGGDWAQDRIIPDCIKAIESNLPVELRNPKAIRPWEHVLEPLYGYLLLAKKLWVDPKKYSGPWNFGPEQNTILNVKEVAQKVTNLYGQGTIKDVSGGTYPHEANLLKLDITKAKIKLDWSPCLSVDELVEFTVEWYKQYKTEDIYNLCRNQIIQYVKKINKMK